MINISSGWAINYPPPHTPAFFWERPLSSSLSLLISLTVLMIFTSPSLLLTNLAYMHGLFSRRSVQDYYQSIRPYQSKHLQGRSKLWLRPSIRFLQDFSQRAPNPVSRGLSARRGVKDEVNARVQPPLTVLTLVVQTSAWWTFVRARNIWQDICMECLRCDSVQAVGRWVGRWGPIKGEVIKG